MQGMKVLRFAVASAIWVIYGVFVALVLYFPVTELIHYIGRETRLFSFYSPHPVGEALLPCLMLAIVYAGMRVIQKKMNPAGRPEIDSRNARED
ncbi:MAG: hypothetical protein Kow0099_13750 [Candidatus Abyssubacteria bacterium]